MINDILNSISISRGSIGWFKCQLLILIQLLLLISGVILIKIAIIYAHVFAIKLLYIHSIVNLIVKKKTRTLTYVQ